MVKKLFLLIISIMLFSSASFAATKQSFVQNVKDFFSPSINVYNRKMTPIYEEENKRIEDYLNKRFANMTKYIEIDTQEVNKKYASFKQDKNNMKNNRILYDLCNAYSKQYKELEKLLVEDKYCQEEYQIYYKNIIKKSEEIATVKMENVHTGKYDTPVVQKATIYLSDGTRANYIEDWEKFKSQIEKSSSVQSMKEKLKEAVDNFNLIADEVWKYSYQYETNKLTNYYQNKYGVQRAGNLDMLLVSPYADVEKGGYYTTSLPLDVIQVLPNGVLVQAHAQSYSIGAISKLAFISTNKKYVNRQKIHGNFMYIGNYTYTNVLGARNTIWNFKELIVPSEPFYFVSK
ncbi:MAG TPA: hypothetical protein H9673_05745 [Candidatus Adamsella sp.]|nr:hypothetical protein [Candidatus Adamsella sp.]